MIWFSASCNLIILPNSVGLAALPLRMTSVAGSKHADNLALCARIAAIDAGSGLLHHLPDARHHLVDLLS
jgi:hypothetical protein